jgi:hypothetical protein
MYIGERGSVVGWGTATTRKGANSIPDEVIGFFNWPNPSRRTIVLGSTKFLTEMNTRNLPRGKGRPARKADDNLTPIYKTTVQKMWEPWRLSSLRAFTARYRDSFIFTFKMCVTIKIHFLENGMFCSYNGGSMILFLTKCPAGSKKQMRWINVLTHALR